LKRRGTSDEDRRRNLVGALRALDPESLQSWRDPTLFLDAMEETISHAMDWQGPHDEDVVAADAAVVDALELTAAAVVAAPAAASWTEPVELSELRYTSFFDDSADTPTSPTLAGVAERLARCVPM
jgi:hypothetical protein